ncbi:alpha/beta fold hydrolase [Candidatus Protofrankia californiensis]|uniref:alpha/beta fold hydrolase n=1 Tax=Candidatus Protofrankia californiensis TaxID=1839754 RepID=UPI0010416DE5|nr:alpha/beta hydrolase [Candidatus Protofrankia californiensis]
MPYVTVGQENSGNIDIYYEDHGSGQPVVLIHGFPLNGASWEKQIPMLLDAGYRVIYYDRRGFGRSSQPVSGYDYDTFTDDLKTLIETLGLRDIVLAGFSMGTGEVTRYLGAYGADRVAKAALFAPLAPYLLQTDDNPEGVPATVFEDIKQAIRDDRFAYQKDFIDNFYNVDVFGSTSRISEQAWQNSWIVAVGASALGTLQCVDAWCTDFRGDVPALSSVPLLVVQGTEDRILPIDNTGRRLPALVKGLQYHEVNGGPHNIGWTHPEVVNPLFLDFLTKQ